MQLARVAYEAYANHTGWKSLATGQGLPQWDQLSEAIKDAWNTSAECVAKKVSDEKLAPRGRGDWLHNVDRAVPDPDPEVES